MILLTLALTSLLLVSPSWCGLTPIEFANNIEKHCFLNDEETGALKINGQKYPLASSLENFIALAEKFEMKNPRIGFKNELLYFIRNFIYENIQFSKFGRIVKWRPKEAEYNDVETLWEPEENVRKAIPQGEDPFTEDEKCSLFFMLSHSVIESPKTVEQRSAASPMRSYTNASFEGRSRTTINPEDLYPQEQGVVSIHGSEAAVSLSRVLTGLYVGLDENRKRNLDSFPRIKNNRPPNEPLPAQDMLDPLYSLTLAEILLIAQWDYEERDLLGRNGVWKSIPVKQDKNVADICPMIYKIEDADSAFTYSSVRGAVDGLILGKIIAKQEMKNKDIRLSQILRMYYSRNGIVENLDDQTQIKASFCYRGLNMDRFQDSLKDQILLFGYLISTNFMQLDIHQKRSWNYYVQLKDDIFRPPSKEFKDYCEEPVTVDRPENLPLENPLDVIVVLDSSDGPDTFLRQQIITGHLVKRLDLRHTGSRLTILKDKRLPSTSGSDGKIELEPVVEDTHSASCAACQVLRVPYDAASIPPRDQVILAIDQLLQARKENETKYNGVNGKVIVYYNFDALQINKGNRDYGRLETALRNLHINHQDTAIYAVGKNSEVLQRFAKKQDITYVMTVAEGDDDVVGQNLYKNIAAVPARLQYSDCEEAKSESGSIFEYFITPNAIQHWEMPPEYLYKSRNIKFFFESQFGSFRVCHHRANREPELEIKNCQDIVNNRKEFKDSNPCSSVSLLACSPYYFSIIGMNSTNGKTELCRDTNDNLCRSTDQIKFKISHEGLRCSGSINLVALPGVLLLGLMFSKIFSKAA